MDPVFQIIEEIGSVIAELVEEDTLRYASLFQAVPRYLLKKDRETVEA